MPRTGTPSSSAPAVGGNANVSGDADELAAQVTRYLRLPEERDQIARRGHELVWARDSWDHRVQEIVAKHEELTA